MQGIVARVIKDKGFGFVRSKEGIEYFFHRSDFEGHWDDLCMDHDNQSPSIRVEFEKADSHKGPRAAYVRRTEFPNQ